MKIRLQKLLAQNSAYSRRQIEELIKAGKITLNGQKAILGDKADEQDQILINNQPIKKISGKSYLILNKPNGYTCTKRYFRNEKNIYELLPTEYQHLNPVGRLDKDSEGLLILTNDGDYLYRLTHPKFEQEKEYLVETDKNINQIMLRVLQTGVDIGSDKNHSLSSKKNLVKADKIKITGPKTFLITITQGQNRQIRRMCGKIGLGVIKLKRVREGKIKLGDLKTGEWKKLE